MEQDLGNGRLNAFKAVGNVPHPELRANLQLDAPFIEAPIPLLGTADGPDFERYVIEVGFGAYPTSWTVIGGGFQPVEAGVLGILSPSDLVTGWSRIRLRVLDNADRAVIDSEMVHVDNFSVISPQDFDIVRLGDMLEIRGSVGVPGFSSYEVEWRPYELVFGAPSPLGPWSTNGVTLTNGGTQPLFGSVLAHFDTNVLAGANRCWIRLSVQGNSLFTETIDLYIDPTLESGWPLRLDHDPAYTHALSVLDPLVVDLDGNGTWEIYAFMTGVLYGFSFSGDPLAGFPVQLQVAGGEIYTTSALTAADIDGDGHGEILLGGVSGNTIFIGAIESDGSNTSDFPLSFDYDESQAGPAVITPYSSVVVADLDADGSDELVFQAFDLLIVAERDGTLLTGELLHLRPGASWLCQRPEAPTRIDATPAVGDMDGDAELEIVVYHQTQDCGQSGAVDMGRLTVFNPDGSVVSGWPRTTTYPPQGSSPAIGDLDGLGGNEIVVAACTDYGTGGIYAFDRFGNTLPGWPQLEVQAAFSCSPALADLDGDGDLEITIGDDSSSRNLFLRQHTGAPYGPGVISNGTTPYATAAADVDQNGTLDVLATYNPFPLSEYGAVTGFGAQARNIAGQSLPAFPKVTESNAWAPIQVLDIDGDGLVEGISSSFKDVGGGFHFNEDWKHRGSIYVWQLPWAANINAPESWNTFHGNLRRTGLYE